MPVVAAHRIALGCSAAAPMVAAGSARPAPGAAAVTTGDRRADRRTAKVVATAPGIARLESTPTLAGRRVRPARPAPTELSVRAESARAPRTAGAHRIALACSAAAPMVAAGSACPVPGAAAVPTGDRRADPRTAKVVATAPGIASLESTPTLAGRRARFARPARPEVSVRAESARASGMAAKGRAPYDESDRRVRRAQAKQPTGDQEVNSNGLSRPAPGTRTF
jgi:hypothetical protein